MVYIGVGKIETHFKPWSTQKPSIANKVCHLDLQPRHRERKFYASYDRKETPTCMANLLAHDYGRIWHQERKQLKFNRMDKEAIAKKRLEIAKKTIKEVAIKAKKRIEANNEMRKKKETDYYWHRPRTPIKPIK